MDGNRRKLRNLLLYIGIPVAVLFIIVVLFNNRRPQQATYKYSDILNYFEEQQVAGYQLNLGTGHPNSLRRALHVQRPLFLYQESPDGSP